MKIAVIAILFLSFCSRAIATIDYVAHGMPATDRDWNGAEIETFARVIRSKVVPLPRLSEKEGAEQFRRLVSEANFGLARDTAIPLDGRIPDFLRFIQAQRDIMMQYVTEANQGADLHREVTELMCYMLKSSTVMIKLSDELVPTIKKDSTFEIRMDGLKKMKNAMAVAFTGAEESLSERNFYDAADLSRLLKTMTDCLPIFAATFSNEFRQELGLKLKKRMEEFPSADDKASIHSMLLLLERQPNQALQHNDPSCHVSCLRTPRASRGRG